MVLLLLLTLSTLAAPVQTSADSIPSAARDAIEAANNEWVVAMTRRDAVQAARPYADDAVFVAANGAVAKGRPAIEQLMRDRFQTMGTVVGGAIVQEGLTRQGALIYEWGRGALEIAAAGKTTRTSGHYLTVWRASADGQWLIVRNLSLPE
jgi:uncharacterized protein (TIGR02246 family)